jgi:glucosyl-3-phosphoglycerate phosphatase
MHLILVRHGETNYNRDGLVLGQADVPLNETGLRQAAALEFALASEKIVAIYASPLRRTMTTAESIASPHGLTVTADKRLIEMDIGELEGMTGAEMVKQHPDLMANWGGVKGPVYRMPGSEERLVDVQARVREAIEEMLARHPEDTVVTVAHNFVILSSLAWLIGIELADFRRLRQSVAAISRVDLRQDHAQVITLNDTCHLAGV